MNIFPLWLYFDKQKQSIGFCYIWFWRAKMTRLYPVLFKYFNFTSIQNTVFCLRRNLFSPWRVTKEKSDDNICSKSHHLCYTGHFTEAFKSVFIINFVFKVNSKKERGVACWNLSPDAGLGKLCWISTVLLFFYLTSASCFMSFWIYEKPLN